MRPLPIIVIGGSTGGVTVLKRLVSLWPADLPAAVFVVLHVSPYHPSQLHEILERSGPLPVVQAVDGQRFEPGTIYVAKPNRHLLVKMEHMKVTYGPRENLARPSIDVLMRSAAAYNHSRVTAALLTGYLSDGVSGLSAVKRCGGSVVVQDPADCSAPDLPRKAIEQIAGIDHILPVDGMAAKLDEIVRRPMRRPHVVPEDLMEDAKVSEHEIPGLSHMHTIGDLMPYTCPECGGSLWKARNEPLTRYICHTGHSFTEETYLNGQAEVIEGSLWSAVRYVQERIDVLQKMIPAQRAKGNEAFAAELEQKVEDMQHHVRVIRQFIISGALGGLQNDVAAKAAR